ncbi:A nuclease of the HNH/ENDO VII superfamily with conserved WHH [Thermoactinomyces sp. DSM 45891]|uniref:HNH endonuclease n=1 Tax=Thermoactinomyces sp. DSM 45891 TaxID=1761907 RepID=UPI000918B47B|nr:HNH endonuclease [Thermoactinomyces sp. DSM 45891]SFX83287.1 A nuclease of the HNH/ENDO VII superfamily with conserved WHH [Thermoactinomyces sp. DSM 45891]
MNNTVRKRLSKFLLIMMITFIALLGFGVAGQGVTYAVDFNIDNTPINGGFNQDIAKTSTTTEKGWLESAGDWLEAKWDRFTKWCKELWDEINNILDELGAKLKEMKDSLWKWGLAVGSALTLAWALLKKQIPALQAVEWALSFLKGVLRGLADIVIGVFDLLVGAGGLLIYMIFNPIESGKKLWHWITHPSEVWNNLSNMVGGVWNEITESWNRMVVNGDANSRSEWLGYATTQIAGFFVGSKGLDKAGKAGSVVSKTGGISSKFPLASKAFDAISDTFKGFGDKVKSLGSKLFGNAKKILVTTTAGTMLLTGITFAWPKIEPFIMKLTDCIAIQQQDAGHYFASIQLPLSKVFDCHVGKDSDIKLPDGSGKTNKIAQVDPYIRERIKEQNVEKYGNEPSSNKTWSPDPKMGEIEDKNGKKYIKYYDGSSKPIVKSKEAGSNFQIKVNGKDYEVPFDENGFPDFSKWVDYESQLNVDQYLLSDVQQFSLLSKRVSKDLKRNEALKKEIDQTLLDVLGNGGGEKNPNAARKLQRFLERSSLKEKIPKAEFDNITSGKGSKSLLEKLESDKDLRDEFVKANHKWIEAGEDPVGYTWHHNQDEGKMQLVESKVHGAVRHTGGRPTWGGHNR